MNTLFFSLRFFHCLTCVGLIIVVVFQAGRAGITGGRGIFGVGGTAQIFSAPSGIAFINKLTVFMACVFLITSLLLAKFYVSMGMVSVVK
ncbi:MAG: preprotein translocase subunit SecG [Endomicrobium sp.]|jgi:preprotein translocase subunit SecG|nr:preprotein translocase subunit SecG [Endomicrobium sp.]